jgi:hypothetical protein
MKHVDVAMTNSRVEAARVRTFAADVINQYPSSSSYDVRNVVSQLQDLQLIVHAQQEDDILSEGQAVDTARNSKYK